MLKRLIKTFKKIVKAEKGYTLVEVADVVAITATLAAVAVPIAIDKMEEARYARATGDVSAIGQAISAFVKDTGRYPFYTVGTTAGIPDNPVIYVLTTADGDDASLDTNTAVNGAMGPANTSFNWDEASKVDTLDDQLVLNIPQYERDERAATSWRGPYLAQMKKDPWGTKYYVNIGHFAQDDLKAVLVLSAGPDKQIDTPIDQAVDDVNTGQATDVKQSDDDVIYRLK